MTMDPARVAAEEGAESGEQQKRGRRVWRAAEGWPAEEARDGDGVGEAQGQAEEAEGQQ